MTPTPGIVVRLTPRTEHLLPGILFAKGDAGQLISLGLAMITGLLSNG
jgi:hypothetical protein